MSQSECERRIYASIIHSQKDDLKVAYERREKMKQELVDANELENIIKLMMDNKDVAENGLQTSVNLGCDFYVDAKVKKTDSILISVGLDLFMECSLPDAIKLLSEKQKMLEHQLEYMSSQVAQVESYITLTTMTVGQQAQFHPKDVAFVAGINADNGAFKPTIVESTQKDILLKLKQAS
jgi:prefoldin subunit 5